jgi:dTMP kinase
LTLILDLPAEVGLARAAQRGEDEGRFEAKGLAFHERLRAAFLAIAAAEPNRCLVIDAAEDIDAVTARINAAVDARWDADHG